MEVGREGRVLVRRLGIGDGAMGREDLVHQYVLFHSLIEGEMVRFGFVARRVFADCFVFDLFSARPLHRHLDELLIWLTSLHRRIILYLLDRIGRLGINVSSLSSLSLSLLSLSSTRRVLSLVFERSI